MPFTLSHVAAVLPFRRAKLVWSALVVGSMAPDFPYLIGTTEYRSLGHSWPGALVFTVPASLVALWLFHNVVKQPALGLLPTGLQRRAQGLLGSFAFGGVVRFGAILISVLLGIATHLLWDGLTHPTSWHGRRWLWLHSLVKVPVFGRMPLFMLLQYASSLFGLVTLGICFALWYRRTPALKSANPAVNSRSALPWVMLAVAMLGAFYRARLEIGVTSTLERADEFMLVAAVTAMAIFFWEIFTYCVLVSTHQSWIIS